MLRSRKHFSIARMLSQPVDEFERLYTKEHAPMVTPETFKGMTKFVATKVTGTPDGSKPPYYRVAELHFPSLAALQAAASSPSGQRAVAHAVSISSGGKPVFLVAEENIRIF
jgi:uncharacterized protein (TIGR02118 family)